MKQREEWDYSFIFSHTAIHIKACQLAQADLPELKDYLSVLHQLLQDTNLFDVIASLGTRLYVHHIELTSFPLCRLNRNLPATVPGRERGRRSGVEGDVEGNTKIFKTTWRNAAGKITKKYSKRKKKAEQNLQSNHKK